MDTDAEESGDEIGRGDTALSGAGGGGSVNLPCAVKGEVCGRRGGPFSKREPSPGERERERQRGQRVGFVVVAVAVAVVVVGEVGGSDREGEITGRNMDGWIRCS